MLFYHAVQYNIKCQSIVNYNQWYFVLQTLRCIEEKRTIPLRMSMEFNIRQDNCQLSTAACLLSAVNCLTITSITCTLLFITIRILVSCEKDSRRYDIPQMQRIYTELLSNSQSFNWFEPNLQISFNGKISGTGF